MSTLYTSVHREDYLGGFSVKRGLFACSTLGNVLYYNAGDSASAIHISSGNNTLTYREG